jgi:hypothetical protein
MDIYIPGPTVAAVRQVTDDKHREAAKAEAAAVATEQADPRSRESFELRRSANRLYGEYQQLLRECWRLERLEKTERATAASGPVKTCAVCGEPSPYFACVECSRA